VVTPEGLKFSRARGSLQLAKGVQPPPTPRQFEHWLGQMYEFENSDITELSLQLFLAHSKNELMQWRGVRRLSVCLFVRL